MAAQNDDFESFADEEDGNFEEKMPSVTSNEYVDDPIQLYLHDISHSKLLTANEEFKLAIMVQAKEQLVLYSNDGFELDVECIFKDMCTTWEQVKRDAARLKHHDPNLREVLQEAVGLKPGEGFEDESAIRNYLNDPRWGSDKHWEDLARDLLRFFMDAYLLPPEWLKGIIAKLDENEGDCLEDSMLTDLPPKADLEERINQVKENANWATQQFVEFNLRLVVSVSKPYSNRGVGMMDLIQEGNMGLLRAISKFDPAKGFRFSTYATWWIRQSMSRYILDNGRTIRIPVHIVEQISKLMKVKQELVQSLGRDPSFSEIALKSGFLSDEDVEAIGKLEWNRDLANPALLHRWEDATQKVESIFKSTEEPVSLESPVGDSEDGVLGDYIRDYESEEPIEEAMRGSLRETIRKTLQALPERQREVLELRFGLVDGHYHTLEDISQKFGLTRERIRQLEARALRQLRDPAKSNPLQDFVDED